MSAAEGVTNSNSDGGFRAKSSPHHAAEGRMDHADTSAVPVLRHEHAGVPGQRYSDAEASCDCIVCSILGTSAAAAAAAAAVYPTARESCLLDCGCHAGVISSNGVNGSQATETDSGTGIQVIPGCTDPMDALMLPI